jgi:hypothetical protein
MYAHVYDTATQRWVPMTAAMLGGTGGGGGGGAAVQPPAVAPVNRSGSITAGGTAQQLMPANAARLGWSIQNHSTGDLWVNDVGGTAAAIQPSIQVPSGALYESPPGCAPTSSISVFGATTGARFAAREW